MSELPKILNEDATPGTLADEEISDLWHSLTPQQQSWLQEYLTNGLNASQAAWDSEYQVTTDESARATGYRNKNHPKIRRLIEHACRRHMSENEALQRLSSFGRVSFADFVSFDDDGMPTIDLQKARERGVLHHVKSIKRDTRQVGEHKEETYIKDLKLRDPVKPNIEILKALGAYDDEEDESAANVTFNAWINRIEAHLSTDEEETGGWPQVEGAPQEKPSHLQEPVQLDE